MEETSSPSKTTGNVTGIRLDVEAEAGKAKVLTFYRATTKTIHVGRQSTHSKYKTGVLSDASALFRCPVISRKHAEITFTGLGTVNIIDLASHHGTRVLSPGAAVSRVLAPHVPCALVDGDVLTFGKSVGRDESLVQPVTVRVRFIFASPIDSPSPSSDVVRSIAVARSVSSSGRYGLYTRSRSSSPARSSDGENPHTSSPSSSQDSSRNLHGENDCERDSDVEEVPRPPALDPARPFGSQQSRHGDMPSRSSSPSLPSLNHSQSSGRLRRFGLLRRLLPLPPMLIHDAHPIYIDVDTDDNGIPGVGNVTKAAHGNGADPTSPISVSSSSPYDSPEVQIIDLPVPIVGAWPGSGATSPSPTGLSSRSASPVHELVPELGEAQIEEQHEHDHDEGEEHDTASLHSTPLRSLPTSPPPSSYEFPPDILATLRRMREEYQQDSARKQKQEGQVALSASESAQEAGRDEEMDIEDEDMDVEASDSPALLANNDPSTADKAEDLEDVSIAGVHGSLTDEDAPGDVDDDEEALASQSQNEQVKELDAAAAILAALHSTVQADERLTGSGKGLSSLAATSADNDSEVNGATSSVQHVSGTISNNTDYEDACILAAIDAAEDVHPFGPAGVSVEARIDNDLTGGARLAADSGAVVDATGNDNATDSGKATVMDKRGTEEDVDMDAALNAYFPIPTLHNERIYPSATNFAPTCCLRRPIPVASTRLPPPPMVVPMGCTLPPLPSTLYKPHPSLTNASSLHSVLSIPPAPVCVRTPTPSRSPSPSSLYTERPTSPRPAMRQPACTYPAQLPVPPACRGPVSAPVPWRCSDVTFTPFSMSPAQTWQKGYFDTPSPEPSSSCTIRSSYDHLTLPVPRGYPLPTLERRPDERQHQRASLAERLRGESDCNNGTPVAQDSDNNPNVLDRNHDHDNAFEDRLAWVKQKVADVERRLLGELDRAAVPTAPQTEKGKEKMQMDEQEQEVVKVAESADDTAAMLLTLQSILSAVDRLRERSVADVTQGMETVKAEVETVRVDAMREMDALRSLKADVTKELDVIRAEMEELRAAMASAAISSTTGAEEIMNVDTTVIENTRATLKRKRDTADENDDVPSSTEAAVQANVPSTSCGTSTEDAASANLGVEVLRPYKRRRSSIAMRIVGGVAKTTAIAAVGAVAAWSALAFS